MRFDCALDFHVRRKSYGEDPYDYKNIHTFIKNDRYVFAREHDLKLCCKVAQPDTSLGVKFFSVPLLQVKGIAINNDICPIPFLLENNDTFTGFVERLRSEATNKLLYLTPEEIITRLPDLSATKDNLISEVDFQSKSLPYFSLSEDSELPRIIKASTKLLGFDSVPKSELGKFKSSINTIRNELKERAQSEVTSSVTTEYQRQVSLNL